MSTRPMHWLNVMPELYLSSALDERLGIQIMPNSCAKFFLCREDELRDKEAFSREIEIGGRNVSCLVYGRGSELRVFLNSCPHTGIRLEWRPDDFLDASGRYLQCAMHGALFEPSNGLCVDGPCVDRTLIKIHVEILEGDVLVSGLDELPESAR